MRKKRHFGKFIMCLILYTIAGTFIWVNPFNFYWCDNTRQIISDFAAGFFKENSVVTYADNGDIEIDIKETKAAANVGLSSPYEKRYITINQGAEIEIAFTVKFDAAVDMTIYNTSGDILASRLVFDEEAFTIKPTGEAETYKIAVQPYSYYIASKSSKGSQSNPGLIMLSFTNEQTVETPEFSPISGEVLAIPQYGAETASTEVREMLSKIEAAYNDDNAYKFLNSLNYGDTEEEYAGNFSAFKIVYTGAKSINSCMGDYGVDLLDRRLVAATVFNNADYFNSSITVKDTVLAVKYYSSEMRDGKWYVDFNAAIKQSNGEIIETQDLTLEMSRKSAIENVPIISKISEGWYTDTLYSSNAGTLQGNTENNIVFNTNPAEFYKVYIDSRKIEFEFVPGMYNGQLLVPADIFMKELGGTVDWDSNRRTLTAHYGNIDIQYVENANSAQIITKADENKYVYELSTPMRVINDKVYIPMRFTAEACNAALDWSGLRVTTGLASHVQLALFAHMVYFPFRLYDMSRFDVNDTTIKPNHSDFRNNVVNSSNYVGSFEKEMNGWECLTWSTSITTFQIAVYRNNKTLVLAIRGTVPENIGSWETHIMHFAEAMFSDGPNPQVYPLYNYLGNTLAEGGIKEYLDKADRIYITGHSLGGYLAYFAADRLCKNDNYVDKIQEVVTFNGEAIDMMEKIADVVKTISPDLISKIPRMIQLGKLNNKDKFKDKIARYIVEGDAVGDWGSKFSKDGLVPPEVIKQGSFEAALWNKHNMMNFYRYLRSKGRNVPKVIN